MNTFKKNDFTLQYLSNADVLIDSFNKVKQGTTWKTATQQYEVNLLEETYKLQEDVRKLFYRVGEFSEFSLNERGKTRWIKALKMRDRVVQRAICDYILMPTFEKHLIYSNTASQKGKGLTKAIDILTKQLRDYFCKHKSNEGYIVLFDFQKYFDNLPQKECGDLLCAELSDPSLMDLIRYLVGLFDVDLSILPQDMQDRYRYGAFNAVEYNNYIRKHHLKPNPNSDNKIYKSQGVGSQISQVTGIGYPYKIDNYFSIVLGKPYGRYMDDSYVVCETIEEAKFCVEQMKKMTKEQKIFLNEKKTQIIKLSSEFVFLKTIFTLTKTGKVKRRVKRKNQTYAMRKMRKLAKKNAPYKTVENSYSGYYGRLKNVSDNNRIKIAKSFLTDYYLITAPF